MARRPRRFYFRVLFSAVLGFSALLLSAQTPLQGETPAQPQFSATAPQTPSDSRTRLAAGDLIDVSVYGVPDLGTKARIGNSGDIYFPLIDYVHIADLTVDEAQSLLEKRLSDGGFVRNPHVTIFVTESTSQAVNVMGEVGRPGTYPVLGDRRLFDLISAAGGLTEKAGRNVSIIPRDKPDQKIELHLASNLAEDTQNNVESVFLPAGTSGPVTVTVTATNVNSDGVPNNGIALDQDFALVAYNMLAVVMAALRSVHGAETIDQEFSLYYVANDIAQTYHGMMIAIPEAEWRVFSRMRRAELVTTLRELAQKVPLKAYRKSPRGPKKPRPKCAGTTKVSHVSTAKILRNRKVSAATP